MVPQKGVAAAAFLLVACTEPREEPGSPPGPEGVDAGAVRDGGEPGRDATVPADAVAEGAPGGLCSGKRCEFENATSRCEETTGLCTPPVCKTGFVDCDPRPGCELRADTDDNCGACGKKCGSGFRCGAKLTCECPYTICTTGRVDVCAILDSDPKNCGACGKACLGTCSFGRCDCLKPSAANLLPNAGFDTGAIGWQAESPDPTVASVAWSATDASGDCHTSGSLFITNSSPMASNVAISACVPVQPGTSYNYGAAIEENFGGSTARGTEGINVCWFSDGACTRPLTCEPSLTLVSAVGGWQPISGAAAAPAGAQAARFRFVLSKEEAAGHLTAWFDMAYLTAVPGKF